MAEWTHNMCARCWKRINPGSGPIFQIKIENRDIETCCFCGQATKAGIYVRHDPKEMNCSHAVQP